jgi:hypothetical protein
MFAITEPLRPGSFTVRYLRRAAGAALLLLVLLVPSRHAIADDDPFSATVTVDATADDVAKARDLARLDGQRKALAALADRIAGGAGKAQLPKLSDNQITDLVASFEVANERMTAVRYVADYTYHFRQAAVQKVLASAGISMGAPNAGAPAAGANPAAADTGAKPAVVLPVLQIGSQPMLWDDPNPWRQAWQARPSGSAAPRLLVPLGDLGDVGTIDAEKARAGDSGALTAIAKKYNADDVLVMAAVQRTGDKPGLDVTVRHYRAGQFVDLHFDSIDANPGEPDSDLFRRAADTIAGDIASGWKNAKEPTGPLGNIVAVLPITGLDDWIKVRGRVSALPGIRKVEVQSLSRQEATLNIQYAGNLDRLKSSLATIDLALEGGDPTWRLARSGVDRP